MSPSPRHLASGPLFCCSSHVRLITSCLPTSTLYLRTVSHSCVSSMVSSVGSCAETAVTLAGGQARGEQSKSVAHHTCMSLCARVAHRESHPPPQIQSLHLVIIVVLRTNVPESRQAQMRRHAGHADRTRARQAPSTFTA